MSSEKSKKDCVIKVVLRRLPRALTESELLEQIDPLPNSINQHWFIDADLDLLPFAFARAYFVFTNETEAISFCDRFSGYVFVDKEGNESASIAEQACSQQIPKFTKDEDIIENLIEKDPEYIKFVETYNITSKTKKIINFDSLLKELEEDKKAINFVRSTPLTEFVTKQYLSREKKRYARVEKFCNRNDRSYKSNNDVYGNNEKSKYYNSLSNKETKFFGLNSSRTNFERKDEKDYKNKNRERRRENFNEKHNNINDDRYDSFNFEKKVIDKEFMNINLVKNENKIYDENNYNFKNEQKNELRKNKERLNQAKIENTGEEKFDNKKNNNQQNSESKSKIKILSSKSSEILLEKDVPNSNYKNVENSEIVRRNKYRPERQLYRPGMHRKMTKGS